MKLSGLICLFLFVAVICNAQEPDSMLTIDNQDIFDAKFGTSKTYNGSSLYGLINGGAELFLEYGFESAWVNQIQLEGDDFKVEIYKMIGADEAFGIYSVSRYQCNSNPQLTQYACQTHYQLQFCAGPYYVSIVNNNGTPKDSALSLKIGTVIAGKIHEPPAHLESYLPGYDHFIFNKDGILIKGTLSLMNSLPDFADFFGDLKGYKVLFLKQPGRILLSARFSTVDDLRRFKTMYQLEDEIPEPQNGVYQPSDLQIIMEH